MLGSHAIAFLICIGAGMSTSLGAAVVYSPHLVKLSNRNILAGGLGLSAGVMLYVSFIEIFVKSHQAFISSGFSDSRAYLYTSLCFFGGLFFMRAIDMLSHWIEHCQSHDSAHHSHISDEEEDDIEVMLHIVERLEEEQKNAEVRTQTTFPVDLDIELSTSNLQRHLEHHNSERALLDITSDLSIRANIDGPQESSNTPANTFPKQDPEILSHKSHVASSHDGNKHLKKMGFMTALAIAIHNFPEGLATFVATAENPKVGIALAIAVAIHNIPEGLCVAVPLYYSSGDRHSAFMYAFLSGVSEVFGGALGWVILSDFFNDLVYAIVFGFVAGMMVCITLYELIPTALKCQSKQYPHLVADFLVLGMLIMAASLVAFKFN